jgi:23S rRNA (guanosine2251-2'-O)-methyltransferase
MNTLRVTNPHSVLAALETRKKDVVRVCLGSDSETAASDGWSAVLSSAKKNGIKLEQGTRSSGREGRTSGSYADIKAREPLHEMDVLNGGAGIYLALDSIQDPHNLGAIFRTAAFFGVRGIFLTEMRSAPLSETVYSVASGGVERVPFACVANLGPVIEKAKDKDLWVIGTSEHAKESLFDLPKDRSWLVILGNEEKGIRRGLLENCDYQVSIPPSGELGSLNVSVATGVILTALRPQN